MNPKAKRDNENQKASLFSEHDLSPFTTFIITFRWALA